MTRIICCFFDSGLSSLRYEKLCEDTLESLLEEIEILLEREDAPENSDSSYAVSNLLASYFFY